MDETKNASETEACRAAGAAASASSDETRSLSGTAGSQSPIEGSSDFSGGDPSKIGRYRIIRRLGQGGFGRVYLAHDDDLDRAVAIKVPSQERITRPEDTEAFLGEARILARLDHPHIVPVHDVGRTEDGLCFVVSKLIEGSDLAVKMDQARPSFRDSAELVATIADALHYAHTRGLVHRDIKPANILIWKRKIEQIDPDLTFKVGLIYGPSGCGKSSLMKAGLLPRLGKHVRPVYIEATPEETEARLLKGLRKVCPELPRELALVDSLASLRRGRILPPDRKVLLVLDQFEQWLHAKRDQENTELVAALRQCDGEHVQAIVMVRDDFWLAASRFMGDLEVDLVPDRNIALVDLFDPRHAKKVLTLVGQAYGALPEKTNDLSREEQSFLDLSLEELIAAGKIVSVRLALFAEMVKAKVWSPTTVREIGGTERVGVTFLEETFGSAQANPKHRDHQKAAQAVLRALLPESGTDIKGRMRSRQELLEASGYENRPRDFDDVIHILDPELRLITPTDPEGSEKMKDEGGRMNDGRESGSISDSSFILPPSSFRYYQLAHDYLVHSLRDWLTRKQRETRRGRAELRLTDRSALWNAKAENRHLPSALE